jgi:hypothetical protein
LIIVLLLIDPKFTGPQTAALPVTTMDNRTLVALAASTIVFPLLLQPLVQTFARSSFALFGKSPKGSRELDEALSRKFGFFWSDLGLSFPI